MKNNVIEVDFSQKKRPEFYKMTTESRGEPYEVSRDNSSSDIDKSQAMIVGLHTVLSTKYGENPIDAIAFEIGEEMDEDFEKALETVIKYIALNPGIQNSLCERVLEEELSEFVKDESSFYVFPLMLNAYMQGLNDFMLVTGILKAADEQIYELLKGEKKDD